MAKISLQCLNPQVPQTKAVQGEFFKKMLMLRVLGEPSKSKTVALLHLCQIKVDEGTTGMIKRMCRTGFELG